MRRFLRAGSCGLLKNVKGSKLIEKRFINLSSVQSSPCLLLDWQTSREAVFKQQKRHYVPKANQQKCWACKKEISNGQPQMQCPHCGILQDVKTDINYFDLLDFPQKFDLEAQALTKRFRQLQTIVHPDKFSNKSSREQINSADWSSLINKAYKTLSIPITRGQYLLELNGIRMPQDNSALDKEFLMEMMEQNEEVEGAKSNNELNVINGRLDKELKEKVQSLAKAFNEKNLEKAKTTLIEMKYLISIQKTVKNKLQASWETKK